MVRYSVMTAKDYDLELVERWKAYLLWALGFIGFCGVHRLYCRRLGTGIVWLFTFGWCFVGQLLDVFLIPSMVNQANQKLVEEHPHLRERMGQAGKPALPAVSETGVNQAQPHQHIIVKEVIKIRCSYCGALVDQHTRRCPECGARV